VSARIILETTAAALAIPVSLTAIAGFSRPVRRFLRKVGQFFDDWGGEPARDGVPARLGVMARLQAIEQNQVQVGEESRRTRTEVQRALMQSEKRTAAVLADIDVRLGDAQEQLAVVHHEVRPNGGNSIKDQMNRLDPAFPDKAKD
jgi:hypothetical protein